MRDERHLHRRRPALLHGPGGGHEHALGRRRVSTPGTAPRSSRRSGRPACAPASATRSPRWPRAWSTYWPSCGRGRGGPARAPWPDRWRWPWWRRCSAWRRPTRPRCWVVRRDRGRGLVSRRRPAGPARGARGHGRAGRSASTRASPPAARCWPTVPASLRRGGGGRERGGADVRRHRDHRGDDPQRGPPRARRIRAASPRRRRRRARRGASSRSRCGWSPRRRSSTATPPATSRSRAPRSRAGDLVRVSLAGANRDPAVFPDPDVFDPGRANIRSQLAFAKGPHVCVAMDLARLEARVALRTLVSAAAGAAAVAARSRRAGWCSGSRRRCGCEGQCPCEQGESCSCRVAFVSVVAARIGP